MFSLYNERNAVCYDEDDDDVQINSSSLVVGRIRRNEVITYLVKVSPALIQFLVRFSLCTFIDYFSKPKYVIIIIIIIRCSVAPYNITMS